MMLVEIPVIVSSVVLVLIILSFVFILHWVIPVFTNLKIIFLVSFLRA